MGLPKDGRSGKNWTQTMASASANASARALGAMSSLVSFRFHHEMDAEKRKQRHEEAKESIKHFIAGNGAGALTTLLTHPLDVIKTR